MHSLARIAAFALLGALLSLPVLGADDKDKKAEPKKDDVKKAEVKKDDVKKDDVKKDVAAKKAELKRMPGKKDSDKDGNTDKTIKAGVVTGKVMAVVEDKKSIRIQVTFRVPKLNPGALQGIANAQNQMLQANSVQAMISAQNALAQAQANLYQLQDVWKDYELTATEDVKIRMGSPPAQFDDKGRIKKYTKKELKELKGDDKLPGYPAEFSDLKQDQIVQVSLVKKKEAPRAPVKKGKDVDPDLLADNLPQMSMIIILYEPKH